MELRREDLGGISFLSIIRFLMIGSVLASHRHLCLADLTGSDPQGICQPKTFPGAESFVCVCNSTFCDSVARYVPLPSNRFSAYTSSSAADRLTQRNYSTSQTSNITDFGIQFSVNASLRYQTITGFGGAFTDAAGINFFNLSAGAQDHLIKAYFSPDGIEYTLGRIPMASCDFSTHPYSYDDFPGDLGLLNFSLTKEDIDYKIPMIRSALDHSSRGVKLFGSPWSAPGWMKTNGHMNGRGHLIGQPGGKYFKAWAQYFVKFVKAYQTTGNVSLWGVTVQNEPADGRLPDFSFQAMGFTAEMERDFVRLDLGPALEAAGLGGMQLMMLDGQTVNLPIWPDVILEDPEAEKYVSGVALHWYLDRYLPDIYPALLRDTHRKFPDKFMLYTEACYDSTFSSKHVDLGSWSRGEGYSKSIITEKAKTTKASPTTASLLPCQPTTSLSFPPSKTLNNWVTGWVDWNLALNMEGGPNWVQNFVDSPIIVDAELDVFYKQPMFYHLGHFSKFILPGSVRVGLSVERKGNLKADNVDSIAFQLIDKTMALIILNMGKEALPISIHDPAVGYMNGVIPPRAIQTYLWSPQGK